MGNCCPCYVDKEGYLDHENRSYALNKVDDAPNTYLPHNIPRALRIRRYTPEEVTIQKKKKKKDMRCQSPWLAKTGFVDKNWIQGA